MRIDSLSDISSKFVEDQNMATAKEVEEAENLADEAIVEDAVRDIEQEENQELSR